MSTEPALLSLTEVAQAIAQKRFSSREVTLACLGRVAQWQPRLNAFMAIETDEALAAADAADAALAKGNVSGALHGVPPEGRRHDSPRLVADGRVRLWADRPQHALRAGA